MKTIVLMADTSADSSRPSTPSAPAQHTKPGSIEAPPPPALLWSPFRGTLGAPTEIFALLIVVFSLAAILFGWALFFRRRSSRSALGGRNSGVLYEGSDRPSGGRRRRHSGHPETLRRNPTLKERGGLPPPREEDPPATQQAPPGPKS